MPTVANMRRYKLYAEGKRAKGLCIRFGCERPRASERVSCDFHLKRYRARYLREKKRKKERG